MCVICDGTSHPPVLILTQFLNSVAFVVVVFLVLVLVVVAGDWLLPLLLLLSLTVLSTSEAVVMSVS